MQLKFGTMKPIFEYRNIPGDDPPPKDNPPPIFGMIRYFSKKH